MMTYDVRNVSFCYAEKNVLDDVSLVLSPGKFYGIVGPNGCGKTTLLDLLTRHKEPVRGRIALNGKELSRFPKKSLSRQTALVPQNFYINFPYTAAEIVMMGRYPHMPRFAAPSESDHRIVRDVMEKADVAQFARRFVTELSGGERQRVVFARALAQDTPVLLLDEASSNLDIHHALRLLGLAAEGVNKRQKTVIAVLQDINLAALYCDHLIFMKQGRIVNQGETEAVLTPETIRAVFNVTGKVSFDPFSNRKQVVFRKDGPQEAPGKKDAPAISTDHDRV
jgi:iron complex transport system ATP-binding protein